MGGVVVDLDRDPVPRVTLHLPARRKPGGERQHGAVHRVGEAATAVLLRLGLEVTRRQRDLVGRRADLGAEVDPVGVVADVGVNTANVLGIVALFIKICGFIFFIMWVRWTIPRFRYDQLMNLGWRILIPLSIINIIITGICILAFK